MRRGSFRTRGEELVYNQLGHETIKDLSRGCVNCGEDKVNCKCFLSTDNKKFLDIKGILWYNSENEGRD